MILFLIFIYLLQYSLGSKYVFVPNNQISSIANWMNEGTPCAGDHIVFEEEKLTVAVLDSDIDVSQIDLSDTGVIYFNDNCIIGKQGSHQCQRRKSPEHVFFEPEIYFGSFHDPHNWIIVGEFPFLHMKLIPGANDEVVFNKGSAQLYLDNVTTIGQFRYDNRSPTTRSFLESVSSVEGQYKVSLGHSLAVIKTIDDLEIITPKSEPLIIKNRGLTHLESMLGRRNPNMDNGTMSLLCPYIPCESRAECIDRVKPTGHCCSICGGLVQFVGYDIGFSSVHKDIDQFFQQHPILNENYGYEFDRLDDDETPSTYQIVVYKKNDEVAFEEGPISDILGYLEYKLDRQLRNNLKIQEFKITMSKIDKAFTLSSIIIGSILFLIIISTITLKLMYNDPIGRQRIHFLMQHTSSVSSYVAVRFLPKTGDNDEIQMIVQEAQVSDEGLKSEEENETPIDELVLPTAVQAEHLSADITSGIQNPMFEEKSASDVEELKLIDL